MTTMVSAVQLVSVRSLDFYVPEDDSFWLYQNQTVSQDLNGLDEWIPYPSAISSFLEQAFRRDDAEAFIGTLYRIDFRELLQTDIDNPQCKIPIRRHNLTSSKKNKKLTEIDIARQERFLSPLSEIESDNTSVDTFYEGSLFIRDWLLKFTNGQMEVKFNVLFPALINGLKLIGSSEPIKVMKDILNELHTVTAETSKQKEGKRMEKLQDCCAKLYTKQCFLFRVVNTTLRNDDRTKLDALGPYCYLVYNYIGRYTDDSMSLRRRLRQVTHRSKSKWVTVYRGDSVCPQKIEEYKRAAGEKDKYFRWLPFVSTSVDPDVAKSFGLNVLFIMKLKSYSSNDQFACLSSNTYFEREKEILIKPGTRFQVLQVRFDAHLNRELVYIQIIPSYVSNLR